MADILVPNNSVHDVVSFELFINDSAVSDVFELLSISVLKEINRVPIAKIVIRDGDPSERTFESSDGNNFIPGNQIRIDIGRDGENETVFTGVIVRHAVRIRENGHSELFLECQDSAVQMTLGKKSKYFIDVTDSQVFDELVGAYTNLSVDSESTELNHPELVQHLVSDWDFLLMRAEANGLLVSVNDSEIKVFKPETSENHVLEVAYGSSILEFEAEMDTRNQWSEVQAKSWDYNNQELFSAETDSAEFTEHGNIEASALAESNNLESFDLNHSGFLPEQELQQWVDGVMLRSRLAKIRGHVSIDGFSAILPGNMIKLTGVGERFEGNAFVTAVKHELGLGNWITKVQFGLDPRRYTYLFKDVNDLPASGLIGCIHGLQIGKVVKLQDDPDGQDRILVKVPVIDENAEGIWMRVASLDAGENRGAFFRPEIDDEVIVGFINADPRDAVVLGMLHSSAKPAPIVAEDDNHVKGFTTRSEMHLEFNDDTKTITIDTPAGNHIILDEDGTKIEIKDQNDNSVLLDSNGITVDSPMEIKVKAGTNINMEATAEFKIKGASVSIQADANLDLKGALIKSAADGINEISGSLVKIN